MVANLVIDADLGQHKISRHIYGHFAEHLGRCIYDGIWVGEDSAIPNTRGIRQDAVEALRKIGIPNLRWPGGCFADEYHWKNGIGPREKRPSSVNSYWGQVTESNHFGTHEFLDLCEQLGCEPYICGNVGSGTVSEMQEWVEYLTFDGESDLADLRRKNGRAEPWKISFWGVGNENWGCGGKMRPEYYADLYRRYQNALHDFGKNRLFRIACGAYEADYQWTEVLMREAAEQMNGLSLHYYTIPGTWQEKGSATQFGEDEWFATLKKSMFMDEIVQKHGTIMDKYDPDKRVGLVVDEWGTWHDAEAGTNEKFLYQQNTLRDALAAGLTLNIFNRHCDRVKMANIAQTVNVLQAMVLTKDEKMIVTPTYHVFGMFAVHQDATLLPLNMSSTEYSHGDESIPALNASASRDADGLIHISLCNLNPNNAMDLKCELRGAKPTRVSGQILTAAEMNARNTFENPEAVKPAAFDCARLDGEDVVLEQPPKSIVVLEIAE
ncbi:MAG: alpha-N-arabinofuranosidase [bacterium]